MEEINSRSQDRLQNYLERMRAAGKNADPVELAKLRDQTRKELASVLSPGQLKEYLLRYSQNAADLRNELRQLHFFNATPEEFRAIFRATDLLDQQIAQFSTDDPNSVLQRKALTQQRDNALKIAIGADRFAQYQRLHDSAYRDAVAAAQQAGTPEAADTIYQINAAAAQEQARLQSNTNMTDQQRLAELKRLEIDQLTANAQAVEPIAAARTARTTTAFALCHPRHRARRIPHLAGHALPHLG